MSVIPDFLLPLAYKVGVVHLNTPRLPCGRGQRVALGEGENVTNFPSLRAPTGRAATHESFNTKTLYEATRDLHYDE